HEDEGRHPLVERQRRRVGVGQRRVDIGIGIPDPRVTHAVDAGPCRRVARRGTWPVAGVRHHDGASGAGKYGHRGSRWDVVGADLPIPSLHRVHGVAVGTGGRAAKRGSARAREDSGVLYIWADLTLRLGLVRRPRWRINILAVSINRAGAPFPQPGVSLIVI